MALLDTVAKGSYKKVPILIEMSTTKGGRKAIQHDYPNSNIQSIEDLGLKPRQYDLDIIIHGTDDPKGDYLEKRNKLFKVFEEGGPGPLEHPFYGKLENIHVITFSIIENFSSLGYSICKVQFKPSETDGRPAKVVDTESEIESKADDAKEGIKETVEKKVKVTPSFIDNLKAGIDKVKKIAQKVQEAANRVRVIKGQIDGFVAKVNFIKNNAGELIRNPALLAATIEDVIVEGTSMYETGAEQLEFLAPLLDFGKEDIPIDPITPGLEERKTNNDALNACVQSNALVESYKSAANTVFETLTDIESEVDRLEESFQSIDEGNVA